MVEESEAPGGQAGRLLDSVALDIADTPEGIHHPAEDQGAIEPSILEAEFCAAGNYGAKVIARFRSLGIPDDIIFGLRSHLAVARIETDRHGSYWPSPNGFGAIIVPAGIPAEPSGWKAIEDLVAFSSNAPDRWWRRKLAVSILGEENVERAQLVGETLTLQPHPLAWLRSGLYGATVLDWDRLNPWVAFGPVPAIAAAPWIAARLRRLYRDTASQPPELIPIGEVAA